MGEPRPGVSGAALGHLAAADRAVAWAALVSIGMVAWSLTGARKAPGPLSAVAKANGPTFAPAPISLLLALLALFLLNLLKQLASPCRSGAGADDWRNIHRRSQAVSSPAH
jgi:hypothetical protein